MRTALVALGLSALMGVEAGSLLRRNAHANAHARLDRRNGYEAPPAEDTETCKIVTYTTWVEYNPPKPTYDTTEYVHSTVYVVPTVVPTPVTTIPVTYSCPVPTPEVTTCPTPGTYTFPAKTITLTSTETVCVETSTILPPGTHSYGHTTTVIATQTHVTCPYATTYTSGTAVYTTITDTVFECPTAGTYTYGGYSTEVTETVTVTYPVATSYAPGTYTHPVSTVTVTATDVVYTCPYTPYSTPVYTAPPVKVETYVAPPATYVAPPPKSTYVAPKPKPTKGVDYSNVGKGKQWCITYTQYNDDKSCKTPQQIETDIADIASKGFKTVRIYAPNCDALEHITSACGSHGIKIVMGVFIERSSYGGYDSADVYKQVDTLIQWKRWDLVELIVIGNESVFNGIISSSDLAALIADCKSKFKAAGYTGSITTSEVVSTLEANPGLCSVIDVIAVNVQPYFNGGYAADAGTFVQSQMKQAQAFCGKTTYCLEAGWPAAGAPIKNAVASPENQKTALESIYAVDEGYIAYYTTYDDGWKDAGMNGGVEQHFGCAKLFPLGGY